MGVEIWNREEGDWEEGWSTTKKKKPADQPKPEDMPDIRDLPELGIIPAVPNKRNNDRPGSGRLPGELNKDKKEDVN